LLEVDRIPSTAKMGLLLSRLVDVFNSMTSGGQPARILLLGLDAAGTIY